MTLWFKQLNWARVMCICVRDRGGNIVNETFLLTACMHPVPCSLLLLPSPPPGSIRFELLVDKRAKPRRFRVGQSETDDRTWGTCRTGEKGYCSKFYHQFLIISFSDSWIILSIRLQIGNHVLRVHTYMELFDPNPKQGEIYNSTHFR